MKFTRQSAWMHRRISVGMAIMGVGVTCVADVPRIRTSFENPVFYVDSGAAVNVPSDSQFVVHGVMGGVGGPAIYSVNSSEYLSASQTFRMSQAQLSAPIGAVEANYGLGEELLAPEEWDSDTDPVIEGENVVWIDYASKLLAIDSGAATVTWTLNDGGSMTTVYTVSPNPKERPVRLYWTDDEAGNALQNSGPIVEFGPNYRVDLYFNSNIDGDNTDYQWNYTTDTNDLPPDVWLSGAKLHAKTGARGNFLLTYSRTDAATGARQLLDYEVVKVLEPMSMLQEVSVGDRLKPVTRQYAVNDLFSMISRGAVDTTGEDPSNVHTYKHTQGSKNGWVWAVRETEAAWQIEIYWKAKEKLDVVWPFEVDIYGVTWGTNSQQFVRGNLADEDFEPKVYIPADLSVEVLPYQTKAGESGSSDVFALVEDGALYTKELGQFLIRYTSENDVWFESVEAVDRTVSTPQVWEIASQLEPVGDADGMAEWPGYLYTPTGDGYNSHYYNYPTAYPSAEPMESSIYGVNQGNLEVWWANASKYWTMTGTGADEVKLPTPLYFPSMVNSYTNTWPANANEIVVASGRGGLGMTMETNGIAALQCDVSGFIIPDSTIGRFGTASAFSVEAWIKPDSTHGVLCAQGSQWKMYWNDGLLSLDLGSTTVTGSQFVEIGVWHHVAATHSASGETRLFLDGGLVAFKRLTNDFGGSGVLYAGQLSGLLDEFRIWNTQRSADELHGSMRLPVLDAPSALAYYAHFNADETDVDYNATLCVLGGRPTALPGVSLTGTAPVVYAQADPDEAGYNPNEEHALMIQENVFALRNDLNSTNTSEPFVLVEYNDLTGTPDMMAFKVVVSNDVYRFEQFLDAGMMIQAPTPLNQLVPTWNSENSFVSALEPFEDRNGRYWAQQGGNDGGSTNIVANFYYPNQSSFWYPVGTTHAEGDLIAWSGTDSDPVDYTYILNWPEEVPGLYIGDTLTTAKNGLPAVRGQLSVDVIYQQSTSENEAARSVTLIDPTQARKVALETIPAGMKSYRDPASGFTLFSELPPLLRSRLYWNSLAADDEELQLTGSYQERTDEHSYLLLNLLTESNKVALLDDSKIRGLDDTWTNSVDAFTTNVVTVINDEQAVDSYALSTEGVGSGYVTLVFNDGKNPDLVDSSEVVSLSVIKVEPELYQGQLDMLQSVNPLDKMSSLHYTADFAGKADRYEFRWEYADPNDGSAPDEESSNWKYYAEDAGVDSATIGDAGVFGLSDHYLRCRYRALDANVISVVGTNWAAWTDPQLCEGWIKRVMKAVNPFDQRIRDYMNYAVDSSLSMLQQAGAPYNGDVPLNYEALDEYGLILIYQKIFEDACDLSIDANVDAQDELSLALMMVSGRLSDFYTMLGNEAYADALNPTVTLGADDAVSASTISSIFCFQNQLPDLLSEELALLRGRDDSLNPPVTEYPFFNRLPWNFTADIVGGQVAYALNYGISDLKGNQNGSLDEGDARILYPQGHGDAWGHYLSAMQFYYQLMNHPHYSWLPQVEGLLVGDSEVTVSYLHEKKFAVAAAAKARAGLDILNKTYRQDYQEGVDAVWSEQQDSNTDRAWGVAEWASRVGQGCYFDWLAANSLLPDQDVDGGHSGIQIIDRQTVPELKELAEAGRAVQQQLNAVDSRLNPLGLAANVVPFDISSAGIDAGETHFEQIYTRATSALQQSVEIFNRVQNCAQALRDQNEACSFDQTMDEEEAAITRQLIQLCGYPYADDIGVGKTYSQDYAGPDLVHYQYVDRYDTAEQQTSLALVYTSYETTGYEDGSYTQQVDLDPNLVEALNGLFEGDLGDINVTVPVVTSTSITNHIVVDAAGIPTKPDSYVGQRRAEGEIQITLSAYLEDLNRLDVARQDCAGAAQAVVNLSNRLSAKYLRDADIESAEYYRKGWLEGLYYTKLALQKGVDVFNIWGEVFEDTIKAVSAAQPTAVGLTVDAGSVTRSVLSTVMATKGAADAVFETAQLGVFEGLDIAMKEVAEAMEKAIDEANGSYDLSIDLLSFKEKVAAQKAPMLRMQVALQSVQTSRMKYTAVLAKADALLVERERMRMNWASDLNAKRYRNMAYQIFRNDELQRYSESFDMAARYCYLAAKAYDYETGLLASDAQYTAGRDFMSQIVKSRTLGRFSSDGDPLVGGAVGDPGLADILARMKANWDVLDGRLGFNNPQRETGRFSLRSELFRIAPAGDSSDENWRYTLEKYRVENLLDLSEFKRNCLPFTPQEAVEPALVIPFSTTIEFRKNYFGQDLAGGDNAYDSTHFATKIRSAGVWFSNFDNAFTSGVANQPRVYLVPVGVDRMRVPSDQLDTIRNWQVADQALPVPYPLSDQDWDSPDWSVLKDTLSNELFDIRKFPSMRAYHDSGDFNASEVINNSRLIGRSVWNTKWLLIIPGGTLLSDADEGLDRFIHGREDAPGVRTENGVDDIKIFFETYSYSGN